MNITKCDLCSKEIANKDTLVHAGVGNVLRFFEFCPQCGKPIEEFLKSKGFLDEK